MSKYPEILDVKTVAKTRLFEIESVDLQFSNGEQRTFERLARRNNGAVMIVPITAEQEFILIREYAVGMEEYELSFPKGFIEPDEPGEEAAIREFKEEIGFGA
jgi:ADP-ribose diphosphatase